MGETVRHSRKRKDRRLGWSFWLSDYSIAVEVSLGFEYFANTSYTQVSEEVGHEPDYDSSDKRTESQLV
jgi:hypothetical protein